MNSFKSFIRSLLGVVKRPVRAYLLRVRYRFVRKRLKKDYRLRKIRVGFLVSEIAKWKGQSVYDYMAQSNDFDPSILVYPSSLELSLDQNRIREELQKKIEYFAKSGMRVVSIWDSLKNQTICLKLINVDLLFYQQPWDIPPAPHPELIAKRALTFYFPYYVPNNFSISETLEKELHYCVYRYFLLNEYQAKCFEKYIKSYNYAGKLVGLGHPALDEFYLKRDYKATKDYVIYAPHFSFLCDYHKRINLPFFSSTFLEQGNIVLSFAKQHPEVNWVFKPHPRLRIALIESGAWTEEEVDLYYKAWEKIGLVSLDSNYSNLFLESKAMITDSCSFLTEYGCTGKPLIRLIPDMGNNMPKPNPDLINLYDSFYKVYQDKELVETLQMIVIDNKDPKKQLRVRNVITSRLAGSYAAHNIVNYIRSLLN